MNGGCPIKSVPFELRQEILGILVGYYSLRMGYQYLNFNLPSPILMMLFINNLFSQGLFARSSDQVVKGERPTGRVELFRHKRGD